MSIIKLERHYRCYEDCLPSGCPTHTATLEFQSVSDSLHFSDGRGQEIYLHPPELEAFLSMWHEIGKGKRDKIEELIHLSIGRASMCWSEIPSGIFNDEVAAKIAQELITAIREDKIKAIREYISREIEKGK